MSSLHSEEKMTVAPSTTSPSINVAAVMRHLDPIAASCDGWIGNLPFLDDISQQLNLPRRYLSLALGGLFTSFILFGLGQSLLCTAVGVLYPAYMSMKALKALEAQPLISDRSCPNCFAISPISRASVTVNEGSINLISSSSNTAEVKPPVV